MDKYRLLLSYAGFPVAWANFLEDSGETDFIVDNYIKEIEKLNVGGLFFVQHLPIQFLNLLYKNFKDEFIKNVKGIDFIEYFDSAFANTENNESRKFKKFTFIYNVGLEKAVNKEFSATMLNSLIKRIKQQNCWVFIVSDLSYTEVSKLYKFKTKNTFCGIKEDDPVIYGV